MPPHLLPERPCDQRRCGASLAVGLGSRCAHCSQDRRGRGSVASAGEERMPPLGLARRPRRATVEVGYIALEMAPAHRGLRSQLGMRQLPAGGGMRSSPPAGRRQVRPDSSPDGEGLFGPDLVALAAFAAGSRLLRYSDLHGTPAGAACGAPHGLAAMACAS